MLRLVSGLDDFLIKILEKMVNKNDPTLLISTDTIHSRIWDEKFRSFQHPKLEWSVNRDTYVGGITNAVCLTGAMNFPVLRLPQAHRRSLSNFIDMTISGQNSEVSENSVDYTIDDTLVLSKLTLTSRDRWPKLKWTFFVIHPTLNIFRELMCFVS